MPILVLPDCTASEQMDFCLDASSGNMGYVIFADQAIKPQFECKNIYEMTSEIARRMGVEQAFTEGRTQEEWLRHLYQQSREAIPALPDFEQFLKQGIFKQRDPDGHHVAYKAFRADAQANPLKTPSGKIEIYSAQLAELAATWELSKDDVIESAAGVCGRFRKPRRSVKQQVSIADDRFPLQGQNPLYLR